MRAPPRGRRGQVVEVPMTRMRALPVRRIPLLIYGAAAAGPSMDGGRRMRPFGISGPADAPPVDVGPSLAARMRASAAHASFVGAVLLACRSPRAARLGIARYAMDEERDAESPRWTTIALTAWLAGGDLDARMGAWAELRRIVDERIVPLRDGGGGEMRDIDSRFFISMERWHP